MDLNFFEIELPTYLRIIIPTTIIIAMWLPFYRRFNLPIRISLLIFIIIPSALLIGSGGVLILISTIIRTFTFFIKTEKTFVYNYTCEKCGFIKELGQTLKVYKCVQCGHENLIDTN